MIGRTALLAEAGYPNGFDMEISVDSSSSDTTKTILEVISSQLSEVGINAEIRDDESTWLATKTVHSVHLCQHGLLIITIPTTLFIHSSEMRIIQSKDH